MSDHHVLSDVVATANLTFLSMLVKITDQHHGEFEISDFRIKTEY